MASPEADSRTYSWAEFKKDWPKSPKLRKFVYFGVPSMIVVTLATGIVWNKSFKELMETVCPPFVSLVREHWGLKEENLLEDMRVRRTLKVQAKNYKLLYRKNGGRDGDIVKSASGTAPLSSIFGGLDPLSNDARLYSLASIDEISCESDSIEDTEKLILSQNDQKLKVEEEEYASARHRVATSYHPRLAVATSSLWDSPKLIDEYEKSLTEKERSIPAKINGNSSSSSSSNSSSGNSDISSEKVYSISQDFIKPVGYISLFQGIMNHYYSGLSVLSQPMKASTFMAEYRFSHALNYTIRGISLYNSYGNRNVGSISESKLSSDTIKSSLALWESPLKVETVTSRQEAEMEISQLKHRIELLKYDMQYSGRDYDATRQDIAKLENEITKIQRSKINKFYLF